MKKFKRIGWLVLRVVGVILLGMILIGGSAVPPGDQTERVRAYTRQIEFDYVGWTLDALGTKFSQLALGTNNYLPNKSQHQMVLGYLDLVRRIQEQESQLTDVYADPNIQDPHFASIALRDSLSELQAQRKQLAPVAEAVLQEQIASVLHDEGLTLGGQPVPPVLYHSTPLPLALIVSPRNTIRQDEDISLLPDLPLDAQVRLEDQVSKSMDVSSLVVEIGGVGVYPTMVQQTSSLDWLSEVVSHEWVHNFLTLRPLGLNYMTSPELRIINETTASIAGKEIGRKVLERYYPELVPPELPPAQAAPAQPPAETPQAPVFDYRAEMHTTRLKVDELLAQGKIDEAEQYMEQRRVIFWNHGYHNLRKLNQAYFAFYGAYADQPGGAAGTDPVGTAVRALRDQSSSLSEFLNRISWVSSFDQLKEIVGE